MGIVWYSKMKYNHIQWFNFAIFLFDTIVGVILFAQFAINYQTKEMCIIKIPCDWLTFSPLIIFIGVESIILTPASCADLHPLYYFCSYDDVKIN